MITPEKLRSVAEAGHPTIVMPDDAPMLADAMELADEFAWLVIESSCTPEGEYHDTRTNDGNAEEIARNLRYLEVRGLLERHPERSEWVRVKEGA
jgi:hypothetical protein